MMEPLEAPAPELIDRPSMDVDIVCVGFGPAMGGFLSTIAPHLNKFETPPQVICYERADGFAFGVSGAVTKARGIRATFPDLKASDIPMAADVTEERVVYLLDPHGASRRPASMALADKALQATHKVEHDSFTLPWAPGFLHKTGGLILSLGQFNQWVSEKVMTEGTVQLWPSSPVAEPLIREGEVKGVRLADQEGMPGMDVRAALTVIADGPVSQIGRQIDDALGTPAGFERNEWAVGMKFVIDLPEGVDLAPGTVYHTIGYPEPEIFGFFYVHPDRVVSVGIFVPSWFSSPIRTTYRYLQHYIQHPFFWRFLQGGRLRSWGAKSILESGKRAEPYLCGNGYARIGEGSGSTNVLTGSGVDEAWTTGTQLGEAVLELLEQKRPFTKENLEATYVRRRRESWIEEEGKLAAAARDGFGWSVASGLIGMAVTWFSHGAFSIKANPAPPHRRLQSLESFYEGVIPAEEIGRIKAGCELEGTTLHDILMDRVGWPAIVYDGQLLVSHQDALLLGGKVQGAPGFADHVVFRFPEVCENCSAQVCVEVCSGEAIAPSKLGGVPAFDREKCVHCGACLWNCSQEIPDGTGRTNISFRAAAGGLHSAEN